MKKNVARLLVSQHIPAYITKSGTTIDAYDNETVFESETIQEVSAENLALWAMCQLKKYQRMERLQKNVGFKLSKKIDLTLSINNRTEKMSTKFSLNLDRLKSLFESTPELIAEAFTQAPQVGGLTKTKAIGYISQVPSKTILAKHAKESDFVEFEMLPDSTTKVEGTEGTIPE